ncbi:MAG: hypothetical protein ACLQVL_13920 [Terriglobia bacterium]
MTDTLRYICEQCTHLNNPQLDFLPANLARHKEIILRDLRELVSVASGGHEKACAILAGSILEAILFSFLQGQEAQIAARRGRPFSFDPEQSLQNYLDIFNKWFRSDFPNLQLPDVLVDYRNLVHFNRELSVPPGECGKAARALLRTLNGLLGELVAFGRLGP